MKRNYLPTLLIAISIFTTPLLGQKGDRDPDFFNVYFVKTVSGPSASTEALYLSFKFNYLNQFKDDHRFIMSRYFSMLNAELTRYSSKHSLMNSGAANFNIFMLRKDKEVVTVKGKTDTIKISNYTRYFEGKFDRLAYVGGGLKILAGRPYTGLHLGSMEIDKIFKTSYFNVGLYYPLSKDLDSDKLNTLHFMLDAEIGVSPDFEGTKPAHEGTVVHHISDVLKSMRVKVEYLQPLATNLSPTDPTFRFAILIPLLTIHR